MLKPIDTSEVTIAVMGATGTGKTSFINLVSGSDLPVGRGLQSCTAVVQTASPFVLDGRSVTLIDTPGFDDTSKTDTDILKIIAEFLSTAYQNGTKLAGVIYLHRISDFRMGGISTRNFKMFRQLCGDNTLKNVLIVTNMWGEVSREIGEAREAELASQDIFFKPVLEKGARLLRHDRTVESAQDILRHLAGNSPEALCIQHELVDQHINIAETAAGEELSRELAAQNKRHEEEMRELQRQTEEAIRVRNEQIRKEQEEETKRLQAEMARAQAESQRLAEQANEERRRLEQRMQEAADAASREAERAAAEHQRYIQGLEEQRLRAENAAAVEIARIQREIDDRNRTVAVTFHVHATTVPGENIYLTGSNDALQNWSSDRALLLSADNYPNWSITVNLPSNTSVEYKYLRKNKGAVSWEKDPNMQITTPGPGSGLLVVYDTFRWKWLFPWFSPKA